MSQQPQYRVIGGGGEVVQQQLQQPEQQQQQQQIRIVKMDGGSAAIPQTQPPQQQQIRVLNSDGTTSALGGNFRIISASGQQGQQIAAVILICGFLRNLSLYVCPTYCM